MWDLETLKRLNDEEVARRQSRSEVKEGMIQQSLNETKGNLWATIEQDRKKKKKR